MPLINNFRYRPEVDGLRAIAVLAVVLFHAGLGVPGGFIGVDVFFVISGFLITSLILKDLEAGKFTLAHFWERRARRIIPAAVVMALTVLAAGWFLLMPSDYAALGRSAVAHALFASNFFFWRTTNYFAGASDEQPLLHTWSLAVEEQFYLFVPLILLGLFHFSAFRRRGVLLPLFLLGFVLSLALSIVLLPRMPAVTFYLLPTRAWELLCGSIIAILPAAAMPRWLRESLCLIALAAILIPCFLYTRKTPFPGLAALPPCLGTALFIWAANQGAGFRIQGAGNRDQKPEVRGQGSENIASLGSCVLPSCVLAFRPIVFIGLISYSLYLWHWPLFAFSRYWALEEFSLTYRLALVAASFLLAVLSWKFVETPFRQRRRGTTRPAMFAWGFGGLAASAACALVLVLNLGFPSRFSERVIGLNPATITAAIASHTTPDDARNGRFPRIGAPAPAPVALMIWGDSHARCILPALDVLAKERSLGILTAWYPATAPVLGYQPNFKFSLGDQTTAFNQAVFEFARDHRIPAFLLAANWSDYFQLASGPGSARPSDAFASGLLDTIRQIKAAGATPYILMEVPNHPIEVPKALRSREVRGTDIRPYASTPDLLAEQNRDMTRLIPDLVAAGARIIDVAQLLLDPATHTYRMDHEGMALYFDKHHLTWYGALFVRQSFAPMMLTVGREVSFHPPTPPAGG